MEIPEPDIYEQKESIRLQPAADHHNELLQELPAGLSEWAVHPGLDSAELLAIEQDGNHIRQADFDFLTSQQAKEVIEEEGIILLNYRALNMVWKKVMI